MGKPIYFGKSVLNPGFSCCTDKITPSNFVIPVRIKKSVTTDTLRSKLT